MSITAFGLDSLCRTKQTSGKIVALTLVGLFLSAGSRWSEAVGAVAPRLRASSVSVLQGRLAAGGGAG